MGSRNVCTICQEVFLFQVEDKDEQPYALKCGHVFHNKCLSQWKANVNKCPQCRATAQNPIRLFFISDSDSNREELDVFMLQAELDKEKSNYLTMKKKFDEAQNTLQMSKEKIIKLQLLNDELEHFVPSLKDCINTLRKENKNSVQTISKLDLELKEKQQELQTLANIKEILDESVDSIAVEKYKNMKPDMVANIVNQWKRNAQYYKQKETSDRNKHIQLQEELKKYKAEAVKNRAELVKLREEVKFLRKAGERQNNIGSPSNSLFLSDDNLAIVGELKRPSTSSPILESPLVKKMKITNVLALNKRPALSTVFPNTSSNGVCSQSISSCNLKVLRDNSKPILNNSSKFVMNSKSISLGSTKSSLGNNSKSICNNTKSSSSIFKKSHSFKSSRDIFNHFDK